MDVFISAVAVAIAFTCLMALMVANFRDRRRLQQAAKLREERKSRRAAAARKYAGQPYSPQKEFSA